MYQVYYNNGMRLRKVSQWALDHRCPWEKEHGMYESVPVYETEAEALKSLDRYSKPIHRDDDGTAIYL